MLVKIDVPPNRVNIIYTGNIRQWYMGWDILYYICGVRSLVLLFMISIGFSELTRFIYIYRYKLTVGKWSTFKCLAIKWVLWISNWGNGYIAFKIGIRLKNSKSTWVRRINWQWTVINSLLTGNCIF